MALTGTGVVANQFISSRRSGTANTAGSTYYLVVAQNTVATSFTATGTPVQLTTHSFSDYGDFVASGDVTAYSDLRLKKDLVKIPDALNKVQQLNGYTYTRIDTSKRQTGVVAQEVQKVLPEAVLDGEHLSVAYGNMVGLLIEAIKELNTKVAFLESQVKEA
jgi:hypothetical protein